MRRRMLLAALAAGALLGGRRADADWIGRGEVIGRVIDSQRRGDARVVRVEVEQQRLQDGPRLGSPNTFSLRHPGVPDPAPGDRVWLRVRESDDLGIRIEAIAAFEAPRRSLSTLVAAGMLAGVFAAVAVRRAHQGGAGLVG